MFPDECRYIPKRETPNELEDICKSLWARSNVTLIIEEAEQYISQGRPLLPFTSGLIRMGRNWGIGIWATTRRIQDINKRFFDLSQHCFFFRCGLKSRDYIADMIGPEYVYNYPSCKYNHTGYAVTTLPPYHALHFNLEDETTEIITLKLGGREHIVEASPKQKTPDKDYLAEEKYKKETLKEQVVEEKKAGVKEAKAEEAKNDKR